MSENEKLENIKVTINKLEALNKEVKSRTVEYGV